MSEYKIVEKFVSINGEGQSAGELSCFIRVAGCNLKCSYCDTSWANACDVSYELMTEEDIYTYVKETGVNNVTLTGGEILIQRDAYGLIERLAGDESLRIEIETNGAVDIEKYKAIKGHVSFTMDYKLPGSNMEEYMQTGNFEFLDMKDTVKFVVTNKDDMDRAVEIIDRFCLLDKTRVYFSSSFNDISPKDIVEYMIENNLNRVRLQLQLHKYIWDPNKKGV